MNFILMNIGPICVTFHNMKDQKKVCDARGQLKNTPEYYICEDYAPEMQRRRGTHYQILNVAKTLPSYKDHTTVKFDKLICHGKKYTCLLGHTVTKIRFVIGNDWIRHWFMMMFLL